MSEQEKAPETAQQESGAANSQFTLVFQRDSARVLDFVPTNIDPFQLWAAAEFLKTQGHRMLAAAERQALAAMQADAAKKKIEVAGRIPDPSQMPPDLRKLTQ